MARIVVAYAWASRFHSPKILLHIVCQKEWLMVIPHLFQD